MHKIVINSILIFIFLFMLLSLYKVLNSRSQQDLNVAKLKSLVNAQEQQNKKLESAYKYYTSSEYIEKVSRDDLSLVKKGETVIVVPSTSAQGGGGGQKGNTQHDLSPLQQWIDLFIN